MVYRRIAVLNTVHNICKIHLRILRPQMNMLIGSKASERPQVNGVVTGPTPLAKRLLT